MKFLITIFIFCFGYKFISSLSDLIRIKWYAHLYNQYLIEQDEKIFECKSLCINLFKKLNIEDAKVPITQKTGYGHMASFTSSLFQNFPDNTNLFAPETSRMFLDAIGICKNNVFNCFNPFYWLKIILFLPQKITNYFNFPQENTFTKIFQFVYWILSIIFTFAISVYPDEINAFFSSLIK